MDSIIDALKAKVKKDNKKLLIGIDINEILRARWLQFDRFYVEEFGKEGAPKEQPYVYNFFKYYEFHDTTEIVKDLKEPEDMPEDINPLDYQIDEKLGEAPADIFLFKKPEEIKYTAKQVYNRFMYEDYVFEIHATAPIMYKDMDLHVNKFYQKYKDFADFIIVSKENLFSIPSTLSFLSKIRSRFSNYRFADTNSETVNTDIIQGLDILITTDPELLGLTAITETKTIKFIKLKRPYNENCLNGIITPVLQINDLIDNTEFEKIINYIKPLTNE